MRNLRNEMTFKLKNVLTKMSNKISTQKPNFENMKTFKSKFYRKNSLKNTEKRHFIPKEF